MEDWKASAAAGGGRDGASSTIPALEVEAEAEAGPGPEVRRAAARPKAPRAAPNRSVAAPVLVPSLRDMDRTDGVRRAPRDAPLGTTKAPAVPVAKDTRVGTMARRRFVMWAARGARGGGGGVLRLLVAVSTEKWLREKLASLRG